MLNNELSGLRDWLINESDAAKMESKALQLRTWADAIERLSTTTPLTLPTIVVPAIPVGVNHYVKHTRYGRHYKTDEAMAFETHFALASREHRGAMMEATEAAIIVTLGPKRRGDVDNFAKQPLDGLVGARVIRSDDTIEHLDVKKRRGPESKTEIWVW